jgi:hypothetical protein
MTTTDIILMIADGIRAGTIKPVMGTAEIRDIGSTTIDAASLEEVGHAPASFTFVCDVVMERKQKGVAKA